jgi:hypothetical protein
MTAPVSSLAPLFAASLAAAAAAQQHWAFVPPTRPPVPVVSGDWAKHDVDRFVQAAREAKGLPAAAEAPRGMWLRRVTFDLTGLPPTLAQLDAFVDDPRPDAHERVVDALLASPAAAEESARWWLDLSRYADTHGMQRDQVRALWRWRDWVIEAYAANLPYDRFVTAQLAGDLLPEATLAQRIASGWLRNNPTSDEGGLIPEEYLARYAMNRTDTFGTAMLGLTVGCAQCHDHKSDPLTTRDYYRLLGFFASFDEQGNDGGALAPEPAVLAPRPEQLPEHERLRAAAAAAQADVGAVAWRRMVFAATGGEALRENPDDGSWLATGAVPGRGDYVLTAHGDFAGLRALRVTALPDATLPERGPGRADNGNFVLTEVELRLDGERIPIAAAEADFAQGGHDAARAIDGDPATGWALQGRHEATALHLLLAAPLPSGREVQLVLRHQSRHERHLLGRFVVHHSSADVGTLLPAWRAATQALAAFEATLPRCMVSRDLPVPRAVHVLTRGRYDQPGERVAPGTPSFLPPLPADAAADRRALAAWLFGADHPLTARVAANRIWLRHFGRGLVATPHDFGTLGAKPSHPELLDWLACELVASGWNERHLHRLLVTSATYRQSSSAAAAGRERDADNVWLSRMGRVRLPAEAIRDQALAVGGLLLTQVGGQSVKIQQPPGIWEAVAFPGSNTERYVAGTGDDLRRRSLYTFWKRTAPPPLLTTFDAPSRETCVVERQGTNTPLQALAIWNDEGMAAAARAFAESCMLQTCAEEGSIVFAFQSLLQRAPTAAESATCRELLGAVRREVSTQPDPDTDVAAALVAWTLLATTLLSLDEALHRN